VEVPIGESLEGNPPASALDITPGKIWTVPPVNTNPPRNARPAEPGFVVKFTVSADGRELTWEGQGTDAKGENVSIRSDLGQAVARYSCAVI
jgi:hypothetical protein